MCRHRLTNQQMFRQITEMFCEITRNLEIIMALVSVDQDALDTLAGSLEAVKAALAAEIADLAAQIANNQPLPPASLDGLNAALADLTALEPPAPTTP